MAEPSDCSACCTANGRYGSVDDTLVDLPEPQEIPGDCEPFPRDPWGTNPKYLFLREIGGPDCLAIFLLQVIAFGEDGPHWGGTLVIDEPVDLKLPLRIPPNFTLAGTGIRNTSTLRVPNDLVGPAITFEPGGNQVLRDLSIETSGALIKLDVPGLAEMQKRPVGIRIVGVGPVYIESVHVFGLKFGISAEDATAIYVNDCTFDNNFINIRLSGGCRHWRIRDTEIRSGWLWGVQIIANLPVGTVDTLIHGCRFESNGNLPFILFGNDDRGALLTDNCFGTFVFGNRFEANPPKAKIASCLEVGSPLANDPDGEATRFLGNLTAQDQPRPGDYNVDPWMALVDDNVKSSPGLTQTHIGFNTSIDFGTNLSLIVHPLNKVNAPTE